MWPKTVAISVLTMRTKTCFLCWNAAYKTKTKICQQTPKNSTSRKTKTEWDTNPRHSLQNFMLCSVREENLKIVYRKSGLRPWQSLTWKTLNHSRISFLFHKMYSNYCLLSRSIMQYALTVRIIFLFSLPIK